MVAIWDGPTTLIEAIDAPVTEAGEHELAPVGVSFFSRSLKYTVQPTSGAARAQSGTLCVASRSGTVGTFPMAASAPAFPPIPRNRLIGREVERSTARTLLLDDAV